MDRRTAVGMKISDHCREVAVSGGSTVVDKNFSKLIRNSQSVTFMCCLICSIADTCSLIDPKLRVDCGWPSISEEQCRQKGCCFDSSVPKTRYCFYKISKYRSD